MDHPRRTREAAAGTAPVSITTTTATDLMRISFDTHPAATRDDGTPHPGARWLAAVVLPWSCLVTVGLSLAGCDDRADAAREHETESRVAVEAPAGDAAEALSEGPVMGRPEIGETAFREAAFTGNHVSVVRAVQQGVDIDATEDDGRTALMLAAFNSHARVVRYLLDSGAAVDARDATDRTALMYAATGPDVETIEMLLEAGADVDAADGDERWTPLMFAAAEGHRDVVRTLLDWGAKVQTRDVDGDRALEFAAENGHQEVAELLRQK